MKVFSYCAQSLADSMQQIAGDGAPLTCPPLDASSFEAGWLEGYDLLLFDLHGAPQDAHWYGDMNLPALSAETLLKARLNGTVVFALNCFLAEEGSPMLDALLTAGASFVVAGDGPNYAGVETVFGAGSLARWFRRFLGQGISAPRSLWLARRAIQPEMIISGRRVATRDASLFRAFTRTAPKIMAA